MEYGSFSRNMSILFLLSSSNWFVALPREMFAQDHLWGGVQENNWEDSRLPDQGGKGKKAKIYLLLDTTHIYDYYTIAKRGRASIGSRKKADIRRKDFREKVIRGDDGGGGGATSEAGTRRGGTWEGGLAHDVQPSKVSLLSDPPIIPNNWGNLWALLDPPAQWCGNPLSIDRSHLRVDGWEEESRKVERAVLLQTSSSVVDSSI